MKVGLFPMVGDLLHVGHITAIDYARRHCDFLIVALNVNPCDNSEKHKPIESVFERYARLRALKAVDAVIPYEGENDLLLLLQTTKYDVRFIGEDHVNKGWTGSMYEHDRGIDYVVIPRRHGVSSSSLRERVYQAELNTMTKKVTR